MVTEPKRLLIMACSQRKRSESGLLPAIERYDGPAFRRDIAAVRQALRQTGHRLLYRRRSDRPGYYVEGRPLLGEKLRRLIAGAVAEVDPEQIAISRRLMPAQRVQQAVSMIRIAEQVAILSTVIKEHFLLW